MKRTGVVAVLLWAAVAGAQAPERAPDASAEAPEGASEDDSVVVKGRKPREETVEDRATSDITRAEMDRRQVRSAPDALRYTPGVYVQQTAHGQGSAYIRGRTGRNTVLMFDGLRINHALFRQGPNQYFFTVDSRVVDRLEVIRGSASVELGASAMSGAINAHPIEPAIDPYTDKSFIVRPLVSGRATSADDELGGRGQLDLQFGKSTGLLVGAGYRDVDQLEAAGPIEGLIADEDHPTPASEKEVPRFEDDGRTQMGTGFEEFAADARLVHLLGPEDRLTLATYLYRQFDAPRTDQCPPPETPENWCLLYEEQFRTHVYATAALSPGWAALDIVDVALSWQRQHERRKNDRDNFVDGGRDDIDVYSARVAGRTAWLRLADGLHLELRGGADGSHQRVSSAGWQIITFIGDGVVRNNPRGQYVDGSAYNEAGVWLGPWLHLGDHWTFRAGARFAWAQAEARAVPETDTRAVDQDWSQVVGNAGVEWRPLVDTLTLNANVEQGFRPPNLDDLTARQLTGQGIQIENPDLQPEEAVTAELGVRLDTQYLRAAVWAFQTWIFDTMERRDAECPPSYRGCTAARRSTPFNLVNLDGTAIIRGAEVELGARPGWGFDARSTLSYAWGEGPTPLVNEDGRRPLSRIPPLNGTVELTWTHASTGGWLGAAMRWAADQDRLSFGDTIDRRIPLGGTPGYRVYDLRAGWRMKQWPRSASINVVFENITDEAYRIHGSSVNGAGRGLLMHFELRPGEVAF